MLELVVRVGFEDGTRHSAGRCHAAPEGGGGGKSAFNLRAWGAGLVNNLRLGFAEQQQKRAAPPAPDQDAAPAAAAAAEEEPGQREATPPELRVVPSSADEEGSWEHWQQVGGPARSRHEQVRRSASQLRGSRRPNNRVLSYPASAVRRSVLSCRPGDAWGSSLP